MKVLLFCPTYRLEAETVDSIMRLDPAGHQLHVMFTRHNPCGVPTYNILYNYRRGRDVVLNGDYDAMLTVESDMIVPPDTLTRLAAIDADVAIGLYVHRHAWANLPLMWNVTVKETTTPAPGTWLNWQPDTAAKAWGNQFDASGGGLGCTLIHRRVLEAVQFRLVKAGRSMFIADCDMWFHHDALLKGFSIVADLGLHCGHITPEREVYWPAPVPQHLRREPLINHSLYHLPEVTHGTANN